MCASKTFDLEGLPDVIKKLGELGPRYRDAVEAALYGQGIALDELANRKGMVPVDSGQLRASHYLTLPQQVAGLPTIEFGYGADYAPEVHERQDMSVSKGGVYKRGSSGQPKWLEKAMNIHARAFLIRMHESIVKFFQQGTKAADLTGIIPETPQVGVEDARHAKYGYTKAQRKQMRQVKKSTGLKLVRRWKRPKKKG